MMERLTKKVFVLLALLIVLFQSFSLPIYASATIKPWNGNPWTGDSWEGSPWDPQQFKWEGDPWEGKSTQGNDWEGNGTEGQGTNGQGTNGQSWEGFDWSNAPWYMDPWVMNGWTPNGFQGNGTDGNPFNGNGTNGNPFVGYDTNGNPFDGNGTNGRSFEGDPTNPRGGETASSFSGDPTDIKLPMGYEVAKYLSNDVVGGQVNMISEFMNFDFEANPNGYRPNGTFFSSLVLNGVKVGLGDKTPGFVNGIADIHDGTLKTIDAVGAIKDYQILKTVRNLDDAQSGARGVLTATDNASDLLSGLSKVGSISKFNFATAAVGAGYSAFELGFNGAKAYDVLNSDVAGNKKVSAVAEASSNLGDLLMNAGVVTAAFPGGQAAGAVMIAGGAAIWGASKLTKLVADNWSGIKKFAKDPVKNTAKAIGKGISKVKGWFS
ncbi:hypothetical protein NQ095_20720 [Rossellomorea sp. SC111]|uniref:hypothetical protein n=1 Tax=Rossellomorea sp. SC111 TaxID=2968985 RepID=UPI00215B4D8A|nr:hypothetical protein [Rossellomorea sp. SC111]MCR8850844.1 hypothetical protein [Rossellomorea sp. SC111]